MQLNSLVKIGIKLEIRIIFKNKLVKISLVGNYSLPDAVKHRTDEG